MNNNLAKMNLNLIKNLIGEKIVRLFLIVFPPEGEESLDHVDIRIGLVVESKLDLLYIISTSMEDIWSPKIETSIIPVSYFEEKEFNIRINKWFSLEMDDDFILEYYDFTNSDYFKNIIGNKIIDIQLIFVENPEEPFGLKLLYNDDFIISLSNTDGNSIITKTFGNFENLKTFNYFGEIEYLSIVK